ncbi:hypothetical protein LA080_000046 [Diaporthe eres]|nr:hypothetical protein LA080_000046 [Diaporthe eres]
MPQGRDYMFECVFELDHSRFVHLEGQKPPMNFHSSQLEFMQVLEGRLCYEIEGKELVLTPEDGEVCIEPWTHHRLLPTPPTDGPSGRRSVVLLSSTDSDQVFKLDYIFYQNWYSYQEEFIIHGGSLSLLQVLIMFDAGGSYLSLPNWIPFGKQISYYVLGIGMGRYLAAAL